MNHISRILLAAALCGIGIAASAQEAKTFKNVKELPEGMVTTQELRQEQWDNWQFTYIFLNRNALPKKLRKALNK